MLYYSKSTGGFYDPVINGLNIPEDSVEITVEEHLAALEGQALGKMIVADDSGKPVLQDRPGPSVADLIASKRLAIEARRLLEEQKGITYTFPGPADDIVQLRNDTDKLNVNGQVTTALILKNQGVTDAVIPFQALSNTTYMLTPDEMITMGRTVSTFCSDLYQKQWAQKALLDALDPATATADDVAAIADWPA